MAMNGTTTPPAGSRASDAPIPGALAELLLDTTVLIDLLRGRSAVERLRELARSGAIAPLVSPISVEEIFRGARANELDRVALLFNGLRIARVGRAEGEAAGKWRRDYAATGTTLSQADCLIAASALTNAAALATGNPRHFPMEGIDVQHWPVGA